MLVYLYCDLKLTILFLCHLGRVSLGCFKCVPLSYVTKMKRMTADKCIQYCQNSNYPYAAHNGCSQCFCANNVPSAQLSCREKGWGQWRYCRSVQGCHRWAKTEVYRTSKIFFPQVERENKTCAYRLKKEDTHRQNRNFNFT